MQTSVMGVALVPFNVVSKALCGNRAWKIMQLSFRYFVSCLKKNIICAKFLPGLRLHDN
jgi:hypothetical protein